MTSPSPLLSKTSARAALVRYAASGALALCATAAMFVGMRALINMTEAQLAADGPRKLIGFVRLAREEVPIDKPPPMPERKPVPQAPATPAVQGVAAPLEVEMPAVQTEGLTAATLPDVPLALESAPSVGVAVTDTDAVPLVRVPPEYPARAAAQNLQGWVMVRFSIGKAGEVLNPVVVDADPPKVFNSAALRSIKQWRYEPRVEDGRPVERHGLLVKIKFELDA